MVQFSETKLPPDFPSPIKKCFIFDETNAVSPLEYEKFGDGRPYWLLLSGVHGDERRVIGRVRSRINRILVQKNGQLPSHIRVFRAFPEAVAQEQHGFDGVNLNRAFPRDTQSISHPRARQIAELRKLYPEIKFVASFHEHRYHTLTDDPELNFNQRRRPDGSIETVEFYMYYTPRDKDNDPYKNKVERLQKQLVLDLKKNKIGVFTGVDDPDPMLAYQAIEGYIFAPDNDHDVTAENFFVRTGKGEAAFVFEIPWRLPGESEIDAVARKDKTVEIIFESFLLPFFDKIKLG